jgi:ATP-dependent Lon protease
MIYNKMPTESSNKISKKGMNKKTDKNIKKKKNDNNPDSDTGSDSDLESDKMDVHEFRKCIKKIFPSKNLDKKIKDGERLKKLNSPKKSSSKKHKHQIEDDDDDDDDDEDYTEDDDSNEEYTDVSDDEEEEEEEDELKNKPKKNSKKHSKKNKHESSEDESSVSSEEIESNNKPSNKVNIVLTIGKSKYDDEEYDDESDEEYTDSSEEDNVTEDEDEEVSTDESDSEDEKPIRKKEKKNKELKIANNNNVTEIDKKMEELVKNDDSEVLKQLKELFAKNKNDKYIGKCIQDYETDIKLAKTKRDKKETKQKKKNVRIFKKIISDKHTMNDFQFYEKLELDHQKKLIKELKEINKISRVEKPYRMTLLDSDMPVRYKAAAIKKINSLKYMDSGSGEFYKVKNWVDTFMTIPFNKYAELPISIEDGVNKCHEFMENAQKTLDEAIYGLNDAKMQIMQMLGQLLTNPKSIGTAIAIHGPAGTGKTSIVKEGISKILNRPFAFIALGGATDSSFLEGHGYTYEGSTWGKIVQILIDSKCMNPVIYFDELDKISDTPRGEEIAGILTHLTDTSQNSQFHDKYFSDVDFDLSKCLFIFSYNDESKINPILKDRMYRIKTKGYSGKEKTVIANNYLLPKIREQVKFGDGDITIPDTVLGYINETHCQKEDGVRNMKRCLEIIHTKLNLYRLMKPGSNLFEGEMSLNVTFPFNVTREIVDKLIKKESDGMELWRTLYV